MKNKAIDILNLEKRVRLLEKELNYKDLEKRIEILEREFNCKTLEKRIKIIENEIMHIKSAIQYQIKKKNN